MLQFDNAQVDGPIRTYRRYGGLSQSHPLTEAEKEYDTTCQAIDYAEREIAKKSMTLFTAGEFMWFNWFVHKMFFFPTQEQLDRQLVQIGGLLKTLEERENEQTRVN